jgi:hypothetical protein
MLSPEALFGDLDLDLFPDGDVDVDDEGAGAEGLPGRFAADAEAQLEVLGFTPASALLSDAEAVPPTRPYDVPADEFAQSVVMWGDDERFSAVSTAPVSLEELPEDAYPTRFTLIEPEWLPDGSLG